MPPKKSGRMLQKEEGLERTDNNLKTHSWPVIAPINQKNYYTDYLKRDEQMLVYRQQSEDKIAREQKERMATLENINGQFGESDAMDVDQQQQNGDGEQQQPQEEERVGSKVIVIHPGSRNLRIGLASDALPRTIPYVVARRGETAEFEENDGEPRPKRQKTVANDSHEDEEPEIDTPQPTRRTRAAIKKAAGPEKEPAPVVNTFETTYNTMSQDLKARMRQNKRRVLPNSRDMVVNYNKRTPPESIKDHNDPYRVEWTEVDEKPEYIVGQTALRIPDDSKPRYKLYWPMVDGVFNEHDYVAKRRWLMDVTIILEEALKQEFEISRRDYKNYSVVLVISDLYDRLYVTEMVELMLKEFFFSQVCIFQESMAATFGAGFSSACVVDIGAQKTSISCIEEGMVIPDSRMNLKYGGDDVTTAMVRMFLTNSFPYQDINLRRRYDWLLAEELKTKYCTLNEADVAVQLYNFHVRAAGKETQKYTFKTYDEVYLASLVYFNTNIIEMCDKLKGRYSLWERSHDIYENVPNDPTSAAQQSLFRSTENPDDNAVATGESAQTGPANATANAAAAIIQTPKPVGVNQFVAHLNGVAGDSTPKSSVAGSPGPDGGTPLPGASTPIPGVNNSMAFPSGASVAGDVPVPEEKEEIEVPVQALDIAIMESITQAAKGDEKKVKDFISGVLVVGGGSQISGFNHLLEERLSALRPSMSNITISVPPRELDPQVIVWKGASVFGKLTGTNDTWIGQKEYDRLGSRVLNYKTMWNW